MWIFLLLLVTTLVLYKLIFLPYRYWKNKNVETGSLLPFFEDNIYMVIGQESIIEMFQRLYRKVPDVRYVGCYQFSMPILMLRTPDLIKQICVKDFDHFLSRRAFPSESADELLSKNLLSLKGLAWKNMRSNISPSFTSSKMRLMYTLICQNTDIFVQHFLKKEGSIIEVELKDVFTRYSNDIIANVAFGLQMDSFEDRTNEFFEMGMKGMNLSSIMMKFKLVLIQLAPALSNMLKISFICKDVQKFFSNITKDTIKLRREKDIKRPDILGHLIEARKGKELNNAVDEPVDSSFAAVQEYLEMKLSKINLTDDDIIGQMFIFFLAGFEIVSSAMCLLSYELAVNPDVQKRLIEEIDENKPSNGEASYETIVNMAYLDMVVSELLRKWPTSIATDRVVTRPYTIEPQLPGEKPVHLDVNDCVVVPIFSIHRDPKYYKNPEKFDPDRFSPENRIKIEPYSYLPFGVGPRNCIGSRLALLEIKAIFFSLLSRFEIVPVQETIIPLQLDPNALTFKSVNDFPFGLKKRF